MSNFENTLQFVRIIDPVCSCGNEIGKLQHELEFEMVKRSNYGEKYVDDTTLSDIITEKNIKRVCCRTRILLSPIGMNLQSGPTLIVYDTKRNDTITSVPVRFKIEPDL